LADLFAREGCYAVSLGDIVREIARERHQDESDPISLANTTETSNWLQKTRGADVIPQEALGRYELVRAAKAYRALVLFSIRASVEVDFILARVANSFGLRRPTRFATRVPCGISAVAMPQWIR
jgi:hypothetical protein